MIKMMFTVFGIKVDNTPVFFMYTSSVDDLRDYLNNCVYYKTNRKYGKGYSKDSNNLLKAGIHESRVRIIPITQVDTEDSAKRFVKFYSEEKGTTIDNGGYNFSEPYDFSVYNEGVVYKKVLWIFKKPVFKFKSRNPQLTILRYFEKLGIKFNDKYYIEPINFVGYEQRNKNFPSRARVYLKYFLIFIKN